MTAEIPEIATPWQNLGLGNLTNELPISDSHFEM